MCILVCQVDRQLQMSGEGQLSQIEASSPSLQEPVSDTALNIPSMFRGQFPKHYCSIMPLDISATLWPLLLPQWCYIYSCSALIPAFFLLHSVIAHWPLTFDAEFSFVIMSETAHWFDLARLPYAQIASLGNRGMKKWSHFSHSAALLCAFPYLPCYDSLKVKLYGYIIWWIIDTKSHVQEADEKMTSESSVNSMCDVSQKHNCSGIEH